MPGNDNRAKLVIGVGVRVNLFHPIHSGAGRRGWVSGRELGGGGEVLLRTRRAIPVDCLNLNRVP